MASSLSTATNRLCAPFQASAAIVPLAVHTSFSVRASGPILTVFALGTTSLAAVAANEGPASEPAAGGSRVVTPLATSSFSRVPFCAITLPSAVSAPATTGAPRSTASSARGGTGSRTSSLPVPRNRASPLSRGSAMAARSAATMMCVSGSQAVQPSRSQAHSRRAGCSTSAASVAGVSTW
jgi:hypothetical protein